MVPRSQQTPAWRLFGAALGAFAIAVQLVVSAWLIVQAAGAGSPAGLSEADVAVICTHDPGLAAATDAGGTPPAPHQHDGQCPACACPQWAKVLVSLPTTPVVVLRHAQPLHPQTDIAATQFASPAPYASRAPPSPLDG